MYEGKPMILVIGGSDTGRTPLAAGLLRKALGAGVVVQTAGVLSHAGEGAMPEAQMALEQLGIDISGHVSKPLRHEAQRDPDLLLAIDRGTELVLFTTFPDDPRVACLPALADMPDVLDPHRMPLGVWVAVARQLQQQITQALPAIRQRLNLPEQVSPSLNGEQVEPQPPGELRPRVLGTGHRTNWNSDEEMQRLMGLIAAEPVEPPVDEAQDVATEQPAAESPAPPSSEPSAPPATEMSAPADGASDAVTASRAEHVNRMAQLLDAAEQVPEIVDWPRLREALVLRLRAVAQQSKGSLDFAPAATLMIEGKLMQHATQPAGESIALLRQSIKRLAAPLNASELAQIGGELGQW